MFVHLWDTTEADVAATLDALCVRTPDMWQVHEDDDVYLYIDFYRDGEGDDEDWKGRFAQHGSPPTVSLAIDISGQHDGWPQVQAFVVSVLAKLRGVATDDDWARLWTGEEIAADRKVDGVLFGGWRRYNARRPAAG